MSAFPLARSGKNDVGKYHHGNNKVPHRHSPLSNRPRTQKVANHWSRLAPNWFGRRRYEGTHALYFRSIGSTWSAGLNYPEYHATDIAFGEAAAAFTGRPLGIRNAPESSFSARNDAEKSHQTDFSRRVCEYRRTAQRDDSLNSSEADVASRSSPIGEPELTLRSKPIELTEKQLEAFIATQKGVSTVVEKMQAAVFSDPVQSKYEAELERIVRKQGFKNFAEYELVSANLSLVMAAIDPQTKVFSDPHAAIRKEIEKVRVDQTSSDRQKKQLLLELNEALKSVQPIEFSTNIELVKNTTIGLM